jgi:hypothetical protein
MMADGEQRLAGSLPLGLAMRVHHLTILAPNKAVPAHGVSQRILRHTFDMITLIVLFASHNVAS